ncbi:MAG: hypothetical protein GWO20_16125, partial [Candidatus Korarchaeota archaeon]|nr:hypothetical protein [Candidatus Korarchaeota archaeon]NIU85705.1 hypothetical protein [Candidatus Thorarchaeota archaeon]NIW14931.1 hypothetical protein [Candidatus Thorarchaeota archaeon]NIW52971.1 hypothetical protein [Candidatus Korarchaeota archaeon]
ALRVLTNKSLLQEIHDRWILSETTSWNVPPLNSIFQNQAAEIHRSKGAIPFEDWWKQGKDILEEWNTIQSVL